VKNNSPTFQQKNNVEASFDISRKKNLDLNVGYALTNHLGITAECQFSHDFTSSRFFGYSYTEQNHSIVQGGIYYFKQFADNSRIKFYYNTGLKLGYAGSYIDDWPAGGRVNYTKIALVGSIYTHSNACSHSLSIALNNMLFNNFSKIYESNENTVSNPGSGFTIEPYYSITLPNKMFGLNLGIGYVFPLKQSFYPNNRLMCSVGIKFRYSELFHHRNK
jgi:hypothetical protein